MLYEVAAGSIHAPQGNVVGSLVSPVNVAIAAIGKPRAAPLADNDTGLLEEVGELIQAARALQDRAHGLPDAVRTDSYLESAVDSLIWQAERLADVSECDLFEPIYEQVIAARQAACAIASVKSEGLEFVLSWWQRTQPAIADYWAAILWISRTWKRSQDAVPQPEDILDSDPVTEVTGNAVTPKLKLTIDKDVRSVSRKGADYSHYKADFDNVKGDCWKMVRALVEADGEPVDMRRLLPDQSSTNLRNFIASIKTEVGNLDVEPVSKGTQTWNLAVTCK